MVVCLRIRQNHNVFPFYLKIVLSFLSAEWRWLPNAGSPKGAGDVELFHSTVRDVDQWVKRANRLPNLGDHEFSCFIVAFRVRCAA